MPRRRWIACASSACRDATPVRHLIKQHQAILDAIAAGRAAAAEQAMKDHLREILKSLPRLARDFPDMFETSEAKVA